MTLRKYLVLGGVAAAGGVAAWRALAMRREVHLSQSPAAFGEARSKIVILGAGFGGLSVALELEKRLSQDDETSVLVIDRDNSLLFTPLLWTVADGRSDPNDVVVPIRDFQRGGRFHLLQAEVERVDLERCEVHTTAATRHYDMLVVALGSTTAVPDLPGLRQYAQVFHSPADAMQLRNRLIDAIEAAHNATDPQERAEWLTFVVSGGGDTGIELAAVIHDYLNTGLFAAYPWLADANVRIVLIQRNERLVPMDDPRTSKEVQQLLEGEGIEVLTSVAVEGMDARCVKTTVGDIPTRNVFWAAGTTAPEVVRQLPAEHARNGSILVDDHLRIRDHPNVYVVGDSAWAFDSKTGNGLPPTAQAAEHMGRYVGRAIAAQRSGQEIGPFEFTPVGHLALLGRRTGVARVGSRTLTGIPAWLLWHAYYLSHIPSWRNRVRLVTSWLSSGVIGRETGELRLESGQHSRQRHVEGVLTGTEA